MGLHSTDLTELAKGFATNNGVVYKFNIPRSLIPMTTVPDLGINDYRIFLNNVTMPNTSKFYPGPLFKDLRDLAYDADAIGIANEYYKNGMYHSVPRGVQPTRFDFTTKQSFENAVKNLSDYTLTVDCYYSDFSSLWRNEQQHCSSVNFSCKLENFEQAKTFIEKGILRCKTSCLRLQAGTSGRKVPRER